MDVKVVKKSDAEDKTIAEDTKSSTAAPNPFVTPNSKNTDQKTTNSFYPELPRRVMEIPGGPRKSDNPITVF